MKLSTKVMLATAVSVTTVMAGFGVVIWNRLATDIREQTTSEANDKVDQILKALEVVDQLSSGHVRSTLNTLVREGQREGDPAIRGAATLNGHPVPDLRLGNTSQVGNFALVEKLKELTGNDSTLFVKQGEDFVRISTTLHKQDGSRAIGTNLDRQGKAYQAVQQGKSFFGVADILGSPYMVGYEPMKDKSGQIIGVWFAGSRLDALGNLGKQISNSKILEHGYVALLKKDGTVVFGPDGVAADAIRKRAESRGEPGWNVVLKPFEAWSYTLQAAYPDADVSTRLSRSAWLILVSTLLMIAIVTVVQYTLMMRLVVKPVRVLTAHLEHADINTSLHLKRSDEIGTLAMEFDGFVQKIRKTLLSVEQASGQLASVTDGFLMNIEHISSNAQETSAQANVVSTATEQVSHGLQTVASATEEMSASIKEIAKNATEAAKVADGAARVAAETNAIVAKLGDSSAEIGQVIRVITSIAQKTDLLALNATVEAARAGEVGAGFAVVANEVKELAKQTSVATEDISKKIEAIQGDTKSAVAAIASISGVIIQVNDISGSIATAVEQQSATTDEMSRSITDAVRSVGEVASNIQGVAQAADGMSKGATDSQKAAKNLAEMSTDLKGLVSGFHLEHRARSRSASQQRSSETMERAEDVAESEEEVIVR